MSDRSQNLNTRGQLPLGRIAGALAALTVSLFFNQACGGFSSIGVNADEAASTAPPYSISPPNVNAADETLSFSMAGNALPTGATVTWSHIFADQNGAPLAPCTELNGENSITYQLNCTQAGVLTVALDISASDGSALGAAELNFSVGAVGSTPIPTPTPDVVGPALFAANCASCHGSLATNNIGAVQVSAIQSAIQTQPQMSGLTSLTSTQLQEIDNALNGI